MEPGPRIPPDAPRADVLAARSELALALWARGDYPTAEILLREIVDGYANVRGEDHPAALSSMSSLASVLCCQGKYGAAETVLRRALERSKKALGEAHPTTLATRNDLGLVLNRLGRHSEVLGEEHARALTRMVKAAMELSAEERYPEAEEILRQALAIYKRVRGMDHPKTLDCMQNLSLVLGYQGRFREAEEMDKLISGQDDEEPERYSSVCYLGEVLGHDATKQDHAVAAEM
jgi:tetratricopeptide (TPR) repeat protein